MAFRLAQGLYGWKIGNEGESSGVENLCWHLIMWGLMDHGEGLDLHTRGSSWRSDVILFTFVKQKTRTMPGCHAENELKGKSRSRELRNYSALRRIDDGGLH